MTLKLDGLSRSDVRHYYGSTILLHVNGVYLVEDFSEGSFSGHLLHGNKWLPTGCTGEELTIVHPPEGYFCVRGDVYFLGQRIQRTRRKGFSTDSYAVSPMLGTSPRRTLTSVEVLMAIFSAATEPVPYSKVVLKLRQGNTGYVFSRTICIVKKGNYREVFMRGRKLGRMKRDGLQLPKKLAVLEQELSEYNIPVALV